MLLICRLTARAWAAEAVEAERCEFEARAARQHHLLSTQVKPASRLACLLLSRLWDAKQIPRRCLGGMRCEGMPPFSNADFDTSQRLTSFSSHSTQAQTLSADMSTSP